MLPVAKPTATPLSVRRSIGSERENPCACRVVKNELRYSAFTCNLPSSALEGVPHRFRHTFATWAIRVDARELDVQYLLGHSSPMMVRRYSATYDSEQAAKAHAAFSPAMQL